MPTNAITNMSQKGGEMKNMSHKNAKKIRKVLKDLKDPPEVKKYVNTRNGIALRKDTKRAIIQRMKRHGIINI